VSEPLRCVAADSILTGWDFSTGAVKCLAFDLEGRTLAEVRLPTDLWTEDGVSELNLMQLEGQARASMRLLVATLRELNLLTRWVAGGISATHHTAGRIDAQRVQVRRAICWNDHTLAKYHEIGLARLGGQDVVKSKIGGPWAIRYTLSHLVKDEATLPEPDWKRTRWILPHGALAAGYLTGRFDVISVSAAASMGIMDLRSCSWSLAMLKALEKPAHRDLVWDQLPQIMDQNEPVGPLATSLLVENDLKIVPPLIFPTSDDQQAGLVGGGAVDAGHVAVILGNSAVVNSSSHQIPATGTLDCMRLNWGPYLWMRCYNNGAQFLDRILGPKPDWDGLEREAREYPPGSDGLSVLPFVAPEPSLNITEPRVEWLPSEPALGGRKYRAALEALAYLIALGVREHEAAGQRITRISVSGGIARSDLMCEILATVLDRPLQRLVSFEGPALGAAVTALAALEMHRRDQAKIEEHYTVADAVAQLVKFRNAVEPTPAWKPVYQEGLRAFAAKIGAPCPSGSPSTSTTPSSCTGAG
jgi:sugar (pentulose or hexulose) kinase